MIWWQKANSSSTTSDRLAKTRECGWCPGTQSIFIFILLYCNKLLRTSHNIIDMIITTSSPEKIKIYLTRHKSETLSPCQSPATTPTKKKCLFFSKLCFFSVFFVPKYTLKLKTSRNNYLCNENAQWSADLLTPPWLTKRSDAFAYNIGILTGGWHFSKYWAQDNIGRNSITYCGQF